MHINLKIDKDGSYLEVTSVYVAIHIRNLEHRY